MLLVTGTFELDPADREAFLAGRLDMMRTSRAEDGCLEYTFAADLLEPGRVILSERWRDRAALDAHLAGMAPSPPTVAMRSVTVEIHEIASTEPLGR
ncbi:MAG: antibiotic biosynthesis monooxygenase [Actinomycetia bacterium]|nr:antibiotic biosynthesis monooxygenase [Actinomycetes bacterium]